MTREDPVHIPVRRRGVWVFVWVALGILAAWHARGWVFLPESVWMFMMAVAAAVAGWALRGIPAKIAMAIALLLLGAGALLARVVEAPVHDVRWALTDEAQLATVVGRVSAAPRVVPAQRGALAHLAAYNPSITRWRIDVLGFMDDKGREHRAAGGLYVRVDEPMREFPDEAALRRGEGVQITGFVSALRGPSNPGEHDFRPAAAQRGIAGSMRVANAALVERRPDVPLRVVDRLAQWRDGVRARGLAAIEGDAERPSDAQRVLAAVLLGERDFGEGHEVEAAFRRVGVAHVLAISGLNVAMVAGMIVGLTRVLGDRPWLERGAVLVAMAAMIAVIPAQAPIVRAVIIVTSAVLADLGGRRYDRINCLALAATGIVIVRPFDLFDAGFQLSFGVVAGLLLFSPSVTDRWAPEPNGRAGRWMVRGLMQAFITSLIAWTVATPILVYHFGLISPLAVISSVIAGPMTAVATACGYFGLLVQGVVPGLGAPALALGTAISRWLVDIVMAMDSLPGIALRMPPVSAWAAGVGVVLIAAWWRVAGQPRVPEVDGRRGRRFGGFALVGASALSLMWCGLHWRAAHRLGHDLVLRIDALDVGDGSAYLVRCGDEAMLFDCGSSWYGIGQRTIPDALWALGRPTVRTLVVSHADIDHYSGVIDAASQIGVREVILTPQFLRACEVLHSPERALLDHLRTTGVAVRSVARGDGWSLGEASLRVLHPEVADTYGRDNAASMVLEIEVDTDAGVRRFLFLGDLDGEGVRDLRSRVDVRVVDPDAIEAPHHGSAQPGGIELVRELRPGIVVQSTGPTRVDDARWADVRQWAEWMCTAVDGAVAVEFMRDGRVVVAPTRPDAAPPRRRAFDGESESP